MGHVSHIDPAAPAQGLRKNAGENSLFEYFVVPVLVQAVAGPNRHMNVDGLVREPQDVPEFRAAR